MLRGFAQVLLLWTVVELTWARGPPRISSPVNHQPLIARAGATIRLVCPIEADPPPLVSWTKDGKSIHEGWERFRKTNRGLKIRELSEEDAGMYQCRAVNGFGSVDVQYQLFVMPDTNDTTTPPHGLPGNIADLPSGTFGRPGELPKFSHPDQMKQNNIMRRLGSHVRLKCRATGKPKPDIMWLKDGVPLTMDRSRNKGYSKWTLVLEDLVQEDSGRYTCKVYNQAGMISYNYTLEVVENAREKPEIIPPHPLNLTVAPGESAMFQCKVKSLVMPHIQWLKKVDSKTNDTITVNGEHFIVLDSGKVWPRREGLYLNKLQIHRATPEDSGMYVCLGANSMGYSHRSAFLVVQPQGNLDQRSGFDGQNRNGQGIISGSYPGYGRSNGENEYSKDQDVDSDNDDDSSGSSSSSLPLIIALPAAIIVILVIVAIYILIRRRTVSQKKAAVVRQPVRLPPQDKMYNMEQYAPLHVQQQQQQQQGLPQGLPPGMQQQQALQQQGLPPHLLQQALASRERAMHMNPYAAPSDSHSHSHSHSDSSSHPKYPPMMHSPQPPPVHYAGC